MAEIAVHHFPPEYGERPLLGRLVIRETEDEAGRRIFAARRPDMPGDQEVLLTADALAVASYFDGNHCIRDVQRRIRERYGRFLHVEIIHMLARTLFRAGLLEPPVDEESETTEPMEVEGHDASAGDPGSGEAGAGEPEEEFLAVGGALTASIRSSAQRDPPLHWRLLQSEGGEDV